MDDEILILVLNWCTYLAWVAISLVVIALAFGAVDSKRSTVLLASLAAPGLTAVLFSYVLVLNRGSRTAQLSSSPDLWSVWATWWFPLVGANLLSVVGVVVLVGYGHAPTMKYRVIAPALVLVSIVLALYHLAANFPMA